MTLRFLGNWVLLLVSLTLSGYSVIPCHARTKEESRRVQAERVKQAIEKFSRSQRAIVRITLYDKSYHEGYVREVEEQEFVLVNSKTGVEVPVGYDEVKQLKAKDFVSGEELSVPKEMPSILRAAKQIANRSAGEGKSTDDAGKSFLSKPAIIILVVLAVGAILIGVELKKS